MIRHDAARAYKDMNEDLRREFEVLRAEGNAHNLRRLARRASAELTGTDAILSSADEITKRSLWGKQDGESAAEREALAELNRSATELERTVASVWDAYDTAEAHTNNETADNVSPLDSSWRRKAG
jgi:hypothetical protein